MRNYLFSFLSILLFLFFSTSPAFANLDKRFIGGQVEIDDRQHNRYFTTRVADLNQPVGGEFGGLDNGRSIWVIEKVPSKSDTYRIKQLNSGLYLDIGSATEVFRVKLKPLNNLANQEFTFVAQTSGTHRYKIRTAYKRASDGRYIVLGFSKDNSNDGLVLESQLNVLTGSEEHQQFDIRFVGDQSAKPYYQNGNLIIVKKDSWTTAWHLRSNADRIVWNIDSNGYLKQNMTKGDIDYSNNSIFMLVQEQTIPDPGNDLGGIKAFRIQHKETRKFLTMEGDYNNLSTGTKVKLENNIPVDSSGHRRQIFFLSLDSPRLISRWGIGTYQATGGTFSDFFFLEPDEDGFVKFKYRNLSDNLGDEWRRSEVSFVPSVPNKSVLEPFIIMNRKTGHLLSDNGVNINGAEVTHNDVSNYDAVWHFEQQSNGFYLIKNALTGNFLTTRYGSNLGSIVKTTVDRDVSGNHNLWSVEVTDGKYYLESIAASGLYMVTNNVDTPDSPLRLGGSWAGGSKWNILPMLTEEAVLDVGTEDYSKIMDSKSINFINPETDMTARDNVLRMIGLPGEPRNYSNNELISKWSESGVNTNASFYAVLKDAITSYYNNTVSPEVLLADYFDSAIAGNRIELAFILRKYILEDLVTKNRNTWTFDEEELVSYLESHISTINSNHAQEMEDSWNDFKAAQNPSNPPLLSDLISFTSADGYDPPEENPLNAAGYINLIQYQQAANYHKFKNPNTYLQTIFTQTSIVGGHLLLSYVGKQTFITAAAEAARSSAISAASAFSDDMLWVIGNQAANTVWRKARFFTNLKLSAAVGSVISVAMEILIKVSMEVAEFIHFENRLLTKVAKLRQHLDIPATQNGFNELDKLSLYQHLDYIFGNTYLSQQWAFELPPGFNSNRLYVNKNVLGGLGSDPKYNSGISWNMAMPSLKDAIAMANEYDIDEIWVTGNGLSLTPYKSSIYYPDEGRKATDNNRNATFSIPAGMKIYGGFSGTETTLAERNFAKYQVILSGEIQQNNSMTDNSYNVVTINQGDATLDGIIIQDGYANNAAVGFSFDQNSGAGIFIDGTTSMTVNIEHCKVRNNYAEKGAGGIEFVGDKSVNLIIRGSLITGNEGRYGGGIRFTETFGPNGVHYLQVIESTITDNYARQANNGCNIDIYKRFFDNNEQNVLLLYNSIVFLNEAFRQTNHPSLKLEGTNVSGILSNSCIDDNQSIANFFSVAGLTQLNPMFKKAIANIPSVGGNYELNFYSPLKNAGYNDPYVTSFDLKNEIRKVRGTIDIGAYEIQSPCTAGEPSSHTISPADLGAYVNINSFRAVNTISTSGAVQFGTDDHTEIIAGKSVILQPGFNSDSGSISTIAVEDCSED